jgi:hypothetical protein
MNEKLPIRSRRVDKRSASTELSMNGGCATLIHPTFFLNLMAVAQRVGTRKTFFIVFINPKGTHSVPYSFFAFFVLFVFFVDRNTN